MSQTTRPLGPALLAAPFLVLATTLTPAEPAPAAACFTAPRGEAPQGRHWYYRYDRVKQRKCWYLGAAGQKVRRGAAPAETPAPAAEETEAPKPAADARPVEPLPAAEALVIPRVSAIGPFAAPSPEASSRPSTFGERIEALAGFLPGVDRMPAATAPVEPVAAPVAAARPPAVETPAAVAPDPAPAPAPATEATSYVLARTFLMLVMAFGLAAVVARAGFVIAGRRRIRVDRDALWREFEAADWAPPLAPSAPANTQAPRPTHEPEVARGAADGRDGRRVPEDPSQLRFLRQSRAA